MSEKPSSHFSLKAQQIESSGQPIRVRRAIHKGYGERGVSYWGFEDVDLAQEAATLQRKRRLTRGVKRGSAIAATAGVLIGTMTVADRYVFDEPRSETVTAAPVPDYGHQHERSLEGLCAPLSMHAEHLLETDCNILPVFRKISSPEADWTPVAHGNDLEALSDDYRHAFEAAMSDPLGKLLTEKFPVEIYQQIERRGADGQPLKVQENGAYDGRKNSLLFEFVANRPPEVYRTWGAIRSVLIHEGTHGLYAEWTADESDEVTQANRQKLTDLWEQDTRIIQEEFRLKHKEELHDTLQEIEAMLQRKLKKFGSEGDLPATIRAAKDYDLQLDKPNGLSEISILLESGEKYPRSGNPVIVIGGSDATEMWSEFFEAEQEKKLLQALVKPYKQDMATMLAFVSEGELNVGLMKTGGHAGENVNERVATTVSTIQTAPEGVVEAVNALPEDRRAIQRQFIAAILDQLKHDQPDVAKHTNIQFVLDRIKD